MHLTQASCPGGPAIPPQPVFSHPTPSDLFLETPSPLGSPAPGTPAWLLTLSIRFQQPLSLFLPLREGFLQGSPPSSPLSCLLSHEESLHPGNPTATPRAAMAKGTSPHAVLLGTVVQIWCHLRQQVAPWPGPRPPGRRLLSPNLTKTWVGRAVPAPCRPPFLRVLPVPQSLAAPPFSPAPTPPNPSPLSDGGATILP